ncbi:MAG: hypothetical protein OJF50_000392 [Nitrospira sp.]|jgi:hypothetical protein|nr:hypothetical protein [Nitrospira sp.]
MPPLRIEQDKTIDILDHGRLERLDYAGLLQFHQGKAIWGTSVTFRALQRAAQCLSESAMWDRQSLQVTSAHPGLGVRDAIEYVTHCVSRKRYRLTEPEREGHCHKDMRFAWWIDDGVRSVAIALRDGFVPETFFALVSRIETPMERPDDREWLERLKERLTEQLWTESLNDLFHVTVDAGRPERAVRTCTS